MEKRPKRLAARINKHKKTKLIVALFLIAVTVGIFIFASGMFSSKNETILPPDVNQTEGLPLPTDGSLPTDHTGYENIKYMETRLKGQESYYSEMHGIVDTMIQQRVDTYKQYSNGVLIATDISASSMVKTAKQLCYVGDFVLWREAENASKTDGVNTVWKKGEPVKIAVDDFRSRYGNPGTEFSVYLLEENTILSAEEVVVNEDGTYSQTFSLDPAPEAAPYYYKQQMKSTGGLDEWPVFEYITVTYTFDETWQVLKSEITEKYSAKMMVSVGCMAHYVTDYEYGTEHAKHTAYDEYFSNYAAKPVETPPDSQEEVTAVKCLSQAFGSVLNDAVTLRLNLDIDGAPVEGKIYLNLAETDVRAKIANIGVWYDGNDFYLNYGGAKLKADLNELIALISGSKNSGDVGSAENAAEVLEEGNGAGEETAEGGLDLNAILEQLGAGEFTVSENRATLDATLELLGLRLPVHFEFVLGEEGQITLGAVSAQIEAEGVSIGAELGFTETNEEELPALNEAQKETYVPVEGCAQSIISLLQNDNLNAEISFEGYGITVNGTIALNLKEMKLKGEFAVAYGGAEKTLSVSYADEVAYLAVDGIKIQASLNEIAALLNRFVALPEAEFNVSIGEIVSSVLSEEFASLIQTSEANGDLQIVLKGTELLKVFGVDFALGDVTLTVSENALSANAFGANVAITAGKAFTVETEGYVSIAKYAESLIDLFTSENLNVTLNYANETLAINGALQLNLKSLVVAGDVTLTYKNITKTIYIAYTEKAVYLALDGLKVTATVDEILALVKDFVSIPESDGAANELLAKVLNLNFGEYISLNEGEGNLNVVLKGTELLKVFGVDFALGDVTLTVSDNALSANAFGANVVITAGKAFAVETEGYVSIAKYADSLIDLFTSENLNVAINYANETLAISGELQLNLKSLVVAGEVTLTYKNITKTVYIAYTDKAVYLALDGLKVAATVDEILALVKDFVSIPESDGAADELLAKVLNLNFGEYISLNEAEGNLNVVLKGTELLKVFGVDFALGDVTLTVSKNSLSANAFGANVNITAGKAFTVDTNGYVSIAKYAESLIDLFTSENLNVAINYANETLAINGALQLNLKSLVVAGEVTLTYKNITKTVNIAYTDKAVYLSLDGLKVTATVDEILALVKDFVEIPESDGAANELLAKVLNLNFGEYISLNEAEGNLNVVLKGTELLKVFGVDFALGEVTLTVSANSLSANALGANVAITAGKAFTADTDGYVSIAKYAESLIDLFTGENLNVTLDYANETLAIDGELQLNLKSLVVAGEVTLTYKNITKTLNLIYTDKAVYLALDGLKVTATVDEILALVKDFVEIPESDGAANELLEKVLNLNFGEYIALNEEEGNLNVVLKGTELLKVFGVDFALGDVTLTVSENSLSANAFGANVAITAGKAFTVYTNGYVSIAKYVESLIDLFTNENLNVTLNYANETLAIDGELQLNLKSLVVAGEVTLTYKNITKTLNLIYTDKAVYLALDGLKMTATVDEILALVKDFVAIPESDGVANELLEKVLNLNFGEYIALNEGEGNLNVVLKGTELLKVFGVDFALGDVTLTVGENSLSANAFGANVAITAGKAFTIDTNGYVALGNILKEVGAIVKNQTISLRGTFDLALTVQEKPFHINFLVNEGYVSWKNASISLYLDTTLLVMNTRHHIVLEAKGGVYRLSYGDLGAELKKSEFKTLEEAFFSAYARVSASVDKVLEMPNPMPTSAALKEKLQSVLSVLQGGEGVAAIGNSLDLTTILNNLKITAPAQKNGVVSLTYDGFTLELIDGTSEGRGVRIALGYQSGKINVSGDADIAAYEKEIPALALQNPLNANDFARFLETIATAAETVTYDELTLRLTGSVQTNDTATYPDSVKYAFDAQVDYHAGGSFPIHLDTENHNLWLNVDSYLHVELALYGKGEGDTDLTLELYLTDLSPDGKKDGVLDVYASVSILEKGHEASNPLRIYAPMDELLTLASEALPLIGVNNSLLNNYLVNRYIDETTAKQLAAIGELFKKSLNISGIVDLISGITEKLPEASAIGEDADEEKAAKDFELFKEVFFVPSEELGQGETNAVRIRLDSKKIYGNELPDILATIATSKQTVAATDGAEAQEQNVLSRVELTNVAFDQTGSESLNLALSVGLGAEQKTPNLGEGYLNVNEMKLSGLIRSVAVAATHQTDTGYSLNDYFYVNGGASIDMEFLGQKITVNVKNIALSVAVDGEGGIEADIHFELDAFKIPLIATVINGNTAVDFSLKNEMIYIKRTQTTDADGKALTTPQIIYRAMPLKVFGENVMDNILFLFNLSSTVGDLMQNINMGGGESTGVKDIGTTVDEYLTSVLHATAGKSESWTVVLNLASLTGGALGDVSVYLATGANGLIRNLNLTTGLSASGITVNVAAQLTYRNPQNIMEAGYKRETESVSGLLEGAMGKKIDEAEALAWANIPYVEGVCGTVRYLDADEIIATQSVIYSRETGELYASLVYPDLTEREQNNRGYALSWDRRDESLPFTGDLDLYVVYTAKTFTITLQSEYPLGVSELEYTYNSTRFALPFPETEERKVTHYVDGEGNEYRTAEDMKRIDRSLALTAVWQAIPYTATFVTGEGTSERTIFYGEEISFPVLPERAGYTFEGWSLVSGRAEHGVAYGDVTFAAQYTPNVYTVRLVSQYPVEGFALRGGVYEREISYEYGSNFALIHAVTYNRDGQEYFLEGFTLEGNSAVYLTVPASITESGVTMTASWKNVGFSVTYVADGTLVATQNYQAGESLSNLPAVPAKVGYTGVWTYAGAAIEEGLRVSGEMQFTAHYTANAYSVTLVSEFALSGYEVQNGRYERTEQYTYGGQALTLSMELKVPKYDFGGYYTKPNGAGERVESVQNITSPLTLYLYWIDNTVRITLHSNLKYAGIGADTLRLEGGHYATSYAFNDDYSLASGEQDAYAPTASGYRWLGWWHENGAKWEHVTDVKHLNGEEIWALWVKEIDVTITKFENSWSTYTIGGTVAGGTAAGANTQKIMDSQITVKFTGVYHLYGKKASQHDTLKYGESVDVNDGKFENGGMTSAYALGWGGASYGGVVLTATYSYDGGEVVLTDGSIVSMDTYSVKVLGGNGETLNEKTIHLDCPFDELDDRLYVKDVVPSYEEVARRGYSVRWNYDLETEITGNLVIQPVYTVNEYAVTLTSEYAIEEEGWSSNAEGNSVYRTRLPYGTIVSVYLGGKTLQTLTVADCDTNEFFFSVPKNTTYTVQQTENSLGFYFRELRDTVIYESAVEFEGMNGSNRLEAQYNDEDGNAYELLIPEVEGYRFMGWYRSNGNSYEKVTSIAATAGITETTVHAVWIADATVTLNSAKFEKKLISSNSNWSFAGSIAGGTVVSDGVSEMIAAQFGYSVTRKVTYTVANDTNGRDAQSKTFPADNLTEFSNAGIKWNAQRSFAKASIEFTYTFAGETFTTTVDSAYIQA